MAKRYSGDTSWAEDRVCENWQPAIDPHHPAVVEAEAQERRSERLFDEAREGIREGCGTRGVAPVAQWILSWLRGGGRGSA